MRGHIIAEDRFLHQGIDHHLFVTGIESIENEYRFEVRCIRPGGAEPETVFENCINYTEALGQAAGRSVDELIQAELATIRSAVFADEDLHVHDP